MVLQDSIPKGTKSAILTSLERITQPVTDFIRGNPIVSTAAVGIGTTGLITGIAAVARTRRKKKKKLQGRKELSRERDERERLLSEGRSVLIDPQGTRDISEFLSPQRTEEK